MLRLSHTALAAHSTGKILNVMHDDAKIPGVYFGLLHNLWQVGIVQVVCFYSIGVVMQPDPVEPEPEEPGSASGPPAGESTSTGAGYATMMTYLLGMSVVIWPLLFRMNHYVRKMLIESDVRVKLCNEIFSGIRVIKMSHF